MRHFVVLQFDILRQFMARQFVKGQGSNNNLNWNKMPSDNFKYDRKISIKQYIQKRQLKWDS